MFLTIFILCNVTCNYLSLSEIPASDKEVLILHIESCHSLLKVLGMLNFSAIVGIHMSNHLRDSQIGQSY